MCVFHHPGGTCTINRRNVMSCGFCYYQGIAPVFLGFIASYPTFIFTFCWRVLVLPPSLPCYFALDFQTLLRVFAGWGFTSGLTYFQKRSAFPGFRFGFHLVMVILSFLGWITFSNLFVIVLSYYPETFRLDFPVYKIRDWLTAFLFKVIVRFSLSGLLLCLFVIFTYDLPSCALFRRSSIISPECSNEIRVYETKRFVSLLGVVCVDLEPGVRVYDHDLQVPLLPCPFGAIPLRIPPCAGLLWLSCSDELSVCVLFDSLLSCLFLLFCTFLMSICM